MIARFVSMEEVKIKEEGRVENRKTAEEWEEKEKTAEKILTQLGFRKLERERRGRFLTVS